MILAFLRAPGSVRLAGDERIAAEEERTETLRHWHVWRWDQGKETLLCFAVECVSNSIYLCADEYGYLFPDSCLTFTTEGHYTDSMFVRKCPLICLKTRSTQRTADRVPCKCFNLSLTLTRSWSWALLEKPPIVQSLKNFPAFYGTRRFITVFTRALHWSLSWARSIQSIHIHFH
jgi:hypothetical protein